MIAVEDILWAPIDVLKTPSPDVDPLIDSDALQEAQLLDLRIHALSSTVGLLFELRTALQFEDGNAAVLVMRGSRQVSWRASGRDGERTAWSVVGSVTHLRSGLLNLDIRLSPSASIEILGASAEFYVIDVPEIGEAPPDYCSEREEHIRNGLPSWDSPFTLLQASHLDG
ncbi:hypothetical protein KGA66_25440 [Actinocrinis puniceicyclus]|uniref:Uncharacterized protein n=1 Tax=Actinocrinis puniceicyclus TaxID=977794 RepID=A0A8J8BFQ9_9ACTN|nr:hypothetical protein [Actinocrinis puniceicyclus]MBS2966411.1 hypothetical protein [Actinocrinis puniceicyclus]